MTLRAGGVVDVWADAYSTSDEHHVFEVLVDVDGTRRKAWLFLMRLMYSGRDFAWLLGHVHGTDHRDSGSRRPASPLRTAGRVSANPAGALMNIGAAGARIARSSRSSIDTARHHARQSYEI